MHAPSRTTSPAPRTDAHSHHRQSRDRGTLIIGGGPAGLAVATMLRCHGEDDIEVLDPSGGWLERWHHRFAAQGIRHLRSPAVHHPHPDPFALLAGSGDNDLVRAGQANLPTTTAFARFIAAVVGTLGLETAVTPARATRLDLDLEGVASVTGSDAVVRRPERVVLATNARRPVVPAALRAWTRHPCVAVGDAADVRRTPPGGEVLIVGGGISAGHLALGAIARGARVTLVSRRRLEVRRYDTHPTWLGPRKLRPFAAEPDPERRRRMIDQARGGGSMPHWMRRGLEQATEDGALRLRQRRTITAVETRGDRLAVSLDDGTTTEVDTLWCATGGALDAATDPLCAALRDLAPTPIAGGLPELDAALRWPGTEVHLVGAAAGLLLGPTAGNLVGHRRAAQRIAAAVRGEDPLRADRLTTGAGACPATADQRASSTTRGA
ncbi:MAG: hypothetical protein EA387_03210 [Nitriliruptor sp.]|nr:MAG: hypothetical protein EA387_03210 [Nitriliruptor sp.]